MLLQRLAAYGEQSADEPAYFRRRTVRWLLPLSLDGRVASADGGLVDLADPSDPAGRNGRQYAVPHLARAAGIAPCLGADDLQYVLGWADETVTATRVPKAHRAFVELVDEWRAAAPEDEAAAALGRFYATGGAERVPQPVGWAAKQVVVVSVGGRRVTELPSLRRFWPTSVERRKTGGTAARSGLCLVCGQVRVLLDRLPQQVPKRLLPGAGNDASLVSANKPIHSYDFSDTLVTVPICVDCGRGAVEGLRRLLDDPKHSMTFRGQDSRLAWWTLGAELPVGEVLADELPATVDGLVRRVHEGMAPDEALDPRRFCALTVGGSSARVMVRDWVDMPLSRLERHIGCWFAEHAFVGRRIDARLYHSLFRLVLATGRWIPGDGPSGAGAYARLDDRSAQRPEDIHRTLVRAALLGKPLPSSLLGHLLDRIRTDGRVDGPRCALLRLILVRSPRRSREAPMPQLDPALDDPVYLSGRLFATLQSIQDSFTRSGGDERKNTTFTDRYLSGAIANPRIALVQGRQQAPAWLKKIGRSKPGTAHALDDRLRDLFDRVDAGDGLPGRIGLQQQALFILGYEHQRAADARARAAYRAATDAEPTDTDQS